MKKSLNKEQWSLHFDGKKIEGREFQAVVIKNEKREVKLASMELDDGKAESITNGLADVLTEYDLWGAMKMLVADTTSVNTGKKTGVIVRLQKMFKARGNRAPQFISCQHHVLDRILRWVMDSDLPSTTKSPNIEYFFVSDLMKNYDELKCQFENRSECIKDNVGWRDDMKFLFHFTCVFRLYKEKREFPFVEFHALPNISNARWNSRAILALLAFILMPHCRSKLHNVCNFISYVWADRWFSDQMYKASDYDELLDSLASYKSAAECLKKHWKVEPSAIDIPRSNQCCECAIKVLQDMHSNCKDRLPLRFILSNDF